jgi:UDP-N-acetylglucosamine 2-epimerase (non-hydrolysing)
MKNILFVFGTRPEAIKMAPIIIYFKSKKSFNVKVCVTAQHRSMLDQVLDFFEIKPDFDLDLMKNNQDLTDLTSLILVKIKPVLNEFKADYVFVHGDTTTSMATALAAYYFGVKVCHIEAGLRTNNIYSPFPEEVNRQITARIADLHFSPTITSELNLINENIQKEKIFVVGNSVIDSLFLTVEKLKTYKDSEIQMLENLINLKKRIILVTGHRRENFGDGFLNICKALNKIAERSDVQIIYPVHLNPHVQKPVYSLLSSNPNIFLIDPLSYPAFIWLMEKSFLILTDSGGVQEEAPSLKKPVLVMRNHTERIEALESGTVKLVGTDFDKIVDSVTEIFEDEKILNRIQNVDNPYGDGETSKLVYNVLMNSI